MTNTAKMVSVRLLKKDSVSRFSMKISGVSVQKTGAVSQNRRDELSAGGAAACP